MRIADFLTASKSGATALVLGLAALMAGRTAAAQGEENPSAEETKGPPAEAADAPGGPSEPPADAPPPETSENLERDIEKLQGKIETQRSRAQAALAEGRFAEAERFARRAGELQEEADALESRLGRAGATPWRDRLQVAPLWCRFDHDLDVDDGWGSSVVWSHRDPHRTSATSFAWRHWDTGTETPGGDERVDVHAWLVGPSFVSQKGRAVRQLRLSAGLIHFTGTEPGDTGPIASAEAAVGVRVRQNLSCQLVGGADIFRTDANQDHTHTNHNFFAGLALEGRF